jgi:hypothetical protein
MGQHPLNIDTQLIAYLVALLFAILFYRQGMLQALIDAIDNFRGGPPTTPTHPSPAGDVALLRKPLKKMFREKPGGQI